MLIHYDNSGRYRYKIIKEVGDGTFGSVWRAINKQTGEIVSLFPIDAKDALRKFFNVLLPS